MQPDQPKRPRDPRLWEIWAHRRRAYDDRTARFHVSDLIFRASWLGLSFPFKLLLRMRRKRQRARRWRELLYGPGTEDDEDSR